MQCCEKCGKPIGAGCHCYGKGVKDYSKNEFYCFCFECQMTKEFQESLSSA